jgi:hypothetical protein
MAAESYSASDASNTVLDPFINEETTFVFGNDDDLTSSARQDQSNAATATSGANSPAGSAAGAGANASASSASPLGGGGGVNLTEVILTVVAGMVLLKFFEK